MRFHVIYSADVQGGDGGARTPHDQEFARQRGRDDLESYTPKLGEWERTEDGETEYAYLEGDWKFGAHGKWCAELSRAEFDQFIDQDYLIAEDCETGGSLTFDGWMPAISFHSPDSEAILDAYVTPIPEHVRSPENERQNDRAWERIRRAMINCYGRGHTA